MEEFFDVDEVNHHSNVDTSRPFRSVKEAVAVFGERFLVGEVYPSKPFCFPEKETPNFSPYVNVHSSPASRCRTPTGNYTTAQLQDTVKKLEVELEKTKAELELLKEKESDTKLALAELHKNVQAKQEQDDYAMKRDKTSTTTSSSLNLSQILSMEDLLFGKKKLMKKKPVIPLVAGLFSRKKEPSTRSLNHRHLRASSHIHWNS